MSSFVNRSLKLRKAIICATIIMIVSFGLVTFVSSSANAAADTCTWTGLGGDANWSTSANWTGCDGAGIPENGDTVIFPSGAAQLNNNNNLANLNLNRVVINGDGYTISGNAIELTSDSQQTITIGGNGNDFGLNTTITASDRKDIYNYNTNTISGDIVLNLSGAFTDFNFFTGGRLVLTGAISGTVPRDFGLNGIFNEGTVEYNATSTFTVGRDSFLYGDSNVECGANDCFGDPANAITSFSGNITFTESLAIANPITVFDFGGDVTQLLQEATGPVTLQGVFTANDSADFIITTSGVFRITNNVVIADNKTISFKGFFGNSNEISGTVSGAGNLYSSGSLTLDGNNTYTGTTTVEATGDDGYGQLYATSSNALGSTDGETIVGKYGRLGFQSVYGVIQSSEPITFTNSDVDGTPNMEYYSLNNIVLSGTLTLDGDTSFYAYNGQSGSLTINGKITGTGDLTYSSYGSSPSFNVNGTTNNDYVGTTIIYDASVIGGKTAGALAIPGDLRVTSPDVASSFYSRESEQIADDATVTLVGGDSLFQINSAKTESIGMLLGNGNVTLASARSILNIGADDIDGTFAGTITSSGGTINKIGNGSWEVTGQGTGTQNDHPTYSVNDGIFIANFFQNTGDNTPINVDGGTLKGNSTIGPLNSSSGIIAPGESPGCILSNGPMVISSLTTIDIEIGGPTQCDDYDSILATGGITLNSPTLNLIMLNSYVPVDGTVFTIGFGIGNTGQFGGLADGDTVVSGGLTFVINYTNNNVTLTKIATPVTTTTVPTTAPNATQVIAAPNSANGALPSTGSNFSLLFYFGLLIVFSGAGFTVISNRRRKIS